MTQAFTLPLALHRTRLRAGRPVPALSRDQGVWLLGSAALTLLPHAARLPLWVSALCGLLLGWRALLMLQQRRPPWRLAILALGLAAALGVRFGYGHFFGKDPGVALLAMLLCLKLLETESARDIRVVVLLCFFLQLAVFLDNQSLPIAALALAATLVSVVALLALVDPAAGNRERLRSGALLLAHGLPFMVLAFVLFPRVPGPLWGLPADAYSGLTGLSDTMSPGSISHLGQSGAIALRAEFDGLPPPPAQRYWRGPVLTEFDGRSWHAARFAESTAPFYTPTGPRIDYQLTLEAHNRRWLLALDHPAAGLAGVSYASDFHALAAEPVRDRSRYALAAHTHSPAGLDESPQILAAARQLPAGYNPRTLALAAELASDEPSAKALLQRVLDHLRASGLGYTLHPPLLGRHSVDEFLFDTRRGFCEHFAAAFTVLMRAAGVPARVVTGYQGGEVNPVDRTLVVRQSDAHAWAEVWLEGRGWIRVDPTALAAPERIESGLAAALPEGEARPLLLRTDLEWLRALRHRWEAASNGWNQWVIGYNSSIQRDLLARLGFGPTDWAALGGAMGGALAVCIAGLWLWATYQRRPVDPLARSWARFSARLAARGLGRDPCEGPLAYGERLAAALPERAAALREIASSYARLRYGAAADAADIRRFERNVRSFRLP
jgi:transglutaminase-like putative cysteine protease